MGIKTLITILATVGFSVNALAEHHEGEKQPFSITGDFAASISFHDNEDNNTGRNHDDFVGDLVQFNMEKNWGQSNFFMTIGYGNTVRSFNAASGSDVATATGLANGIDVLQARYTYTTHYGLGVTFGKFESPVGHETYVQMDNSQYSRSYGFQLAPFFNTGGRIEYGQEMWKVGLIVSNGSGMESDIRDKNKTMALVVDVDPIENLHVDLNYVTGTEGYANLVPSKVQTNPAATVGSLAGQTAQISILDASVSYMFNEMFDVAVNYIDHGQQASAAGSSQNKASSLAAYLNGNFGMFGLGFRYEQLTYDDGISAYNGLSGAAAPFGSNALATPDNTITAMTLTARAEIDQNAMVLLEYKMDSSDQQIWDDKDGNVSDSQSTLTAAVMYRF